MTKYALITRHARKLLVYAQKFNPRKQMIPCVVRKSIEIFPEWIEGQLTQALTNQEKGCCKVHGVYWQAKLYRINRPLCILPDAPIKILGREELCLLVQPLNAT